MRVSTSQIFNDGTRGIGNNQASLYKLQNQLSTGRRILTPADDPINAAESLKITQSISVNEQFQTNQSDASSQLALVESKLGDVGELLTSVKTRLVQAGNDTLNGSDRQAIAAELRQRYDELMGLANGADGSGKYLFSGFRGNTQPFSAAGVVGSRTVTYAGDDGQRVLQVENQRLIPVSESGSDVFMRIKQGNGDFMTSPGAANTGSGIISSGSAVTGYDGNTYQVVFDPVVAPATVPTTFHVDMTTPAGVTTANWLPPGQAYTSGSTITLTNGANSIQFEIKGAPAAGDSFSIAPSTNEDVFTVIDRAIKALESSGSTDAAKAKFRNELVHVGDGLDRAIDNALRVRTDMGARMLELDALNASAEDVGLLYGTQLSNLVDLDYNEAISEMERRKLALEAAQLSFKQTSQLSLFNVL